LLLDLVLNYLFIYLLTYLFIYLFIYLLELFTYAVIKSEVEVNPSLKRLSLRLSLVGLDQ